MNPRSKKFVSEFGDRLVVMGYLDDASLSRAKNAQKRSDERFDLVLTRLGLVNEQNLTDALAVHLSVSRFDPKMLPSFPLLEDKLPLQFLNSNSILPISIDDKEIKLAGSDPFNSDTFVAVSYQVDRGVKFVLATPAELENAIGMLYPLAENSGQSHDSFDVEDEASQDDLQRLRDIASEAPIVQFVNQLIANGIEQGVSDIHIESWDDRVRIRFRLDGILQTEQEISLSMKAAIISRIKILARLNIAEQRLPQDGRIKHNVRGRDVDLRVSTIPTISGESVVLRILDRSHIELDFSALGMNGPIYHNYRSLLEQPNGIILVTGPTGSGKTTTLYTSLDALNHTERKIFTVEDPVEFQLRGINQIQVKPNIGLSFANALRSILRQDPDIIMIGEIRDVETAKIAVQAALTGHLVFATLHTNDAAGSITRLLDMGVEGYLLASTIIGVVAQRLVRKLCPYCAIPLDECQNDLNVALVSQMKGTNEDISNKQSKKSPQGCEHCHRTGFAGRTVILELLVMDDKLQKLTVEGETTHEMGKAAVSAGMQTMQQHGFERVLAGETSRDEVMRVIGAE